MKFLQRLMKLTLGSFMNFFKYYQEEAHQQKALEQLYEQLPEELLQEEADELLMGALSRRSPRRRWFIGHLI